MKNYINVSSSSNSQTTILQSIYRVNKAVRARLLILVDFIDDQEHHTHQEGQGTDHQQGHLKEKWQKLHFWHSMLHRSVEEHHKLTASV